MLVGTKIVTECFENVSICRRVLYANCFVAGTACATGLILNQKRHFIDVVTTLEKKPCFTLVFCPIGYLFCTPSWQSMRQLLCTGFYQI